MHGINGTVKINNSFLFGNQYNNDFEFLISPNLRTDLLFNLTPSLF